MAAVWNSRFNPPPASRAPHHVGFIAAVIVHVIAIAALLSYAPARQSLFEAAPIMVSLLSPPPPEKKIEGPKPRPVIKPQPVKPVEMPMIVAPVDAPSPEVAAPQPPAPATPQPVSAPPAPTAPSTPVTITQPIFDADYLGNPAAIYPVQSIRRGEQGRVMLRVLVNATGRADEVQISSSSGSPRLDDSARETVKRWRFVPARRGANPVSDWVVVPISFNLKR